MIETCFPVELKISKNNGTLIARFLAIYVCGVLQLNNKNYCYQNLPWAKHLFDIQAKLLFLAAAITKAPSVSKHTPENNERNDGAQRANTDPQNSLKQIREIQQSEFYTSVKL